MDFVAIDFETANNNYNSACSIGLIAVSNNEIVEEFYSLIKPSILKFDIRNIQINKLTEDDVKDAPTFPEVWGKIKNYFNSETIIIAHNAVFDMNVLKNCLSEYDLQIPNFNYVCSIPISARLCRGQNIGKSLEDRCNFFNVPLEQHHNALSDAKACAKLVLCCINKSKRKSFKTFCSTYSSLPIKNFLQLKTSKTYNIPGFKSKKITLSAITSTNSNIDINNKLYGKNIVFTGELKSMDRKEAMQKAVDLGAILKNNVSSRTNFVVVGIQDKSIVGADGMSSKERKAYELQQKGHAIEILNEEEYLVLI